MSLLLKNNLSIKVLNRKFSVLRLFGRYILWSQRFQKQVKYILGVSYLFYSSKFAVARKHSFNAIRPFFSGSMTMIMGFQGHYFR